MSLKIIQNSHCEMSYNKMLVLHVKMCPIKTVFLYTKNSRMSKY